MSLTENGLGVADGIRGNTFHHPPNEGARAPGLLDEHVDGVNPRNSGRPDLYPHAPMHFRDGPQQPAAGRLDEVTAEPAAAGKAAAAEVPAMQLAPLAVSG